MLYSKIVSSLTKVFKTENPVSPPECNHITALRGDTVSFQTVYYSDENISCKVNVISELAKYTLVRSVEYVPSEYPGDPAAMLKDGNYIKTAKGEFPDILRKLRGGNLKITKNKYRTLWIDVEIPEELAAGIYEVHIELFLPDGKILSTLTQKIEVYAASLPPARLIHTEWFHTDCIADYYGYEVFSEKHWKTIEHFMCVAAKRGINMILTPVFTPPLDTEVGGERTTVQLVDVTFNNNSWSFGFDKLTRWIDTAERSGIKYFEISHLFTQWGANAAPKIMADCNGEYKRVFGWDTPVEDGRYPEFLSKFLPALTSYLKKMKIADRCYFHVSDEPSLDNMANYIRAKNIIAPYLKGFHLMDALSSYEFYETGACELPIPASNHIAPFIEHNVKNLWTYYCVSQNVGVSNRFMSMSLARTRALGVQLFKYHIAGFLQWGFNFYNSQYSKEHINPYKVTDAGGKFPSGDAFIVYPGGNEKPEESIRLMAFFAAQQDLRALTALAEKTSYENVMSIVEDGLDEPITFSCYPHSDYYYISLRNKVNKELAK